MRFIEKTRNTRKFLHVFECDGTGVSRGVQCVQPVHLFRIGHPAHVAPNRPEQSLQIKIILYLSLYKNLVYSVS